MSAGFTPGPLWIEASIYEGFAAAVVGRVVNPGEADRDTRTLAHVRGLPDATLFAAAPDLYAALVAVKQEMWLSARHQWTREDFNNWAIIRQINAALTKADGKPGRAA
jgi:hypothetical protein